MRTDASGTRLRAPDMVRRPRVRYLERMTETAPKPRLVLVDGSGYIFRAFFALPPMTRKDGTPINAVYGFASMLSRLMGEWPNDDMVVVFDAGRTTFRNVMYADYKANRQEPPEELVPQFPLVREAARAYGLPTVEVEGFEADDLIASYAKAAKADGRPVVVVSNDKDLMQLLCDGVRIWDPMKGKEIGLPEVEARFGVGPDLVRDCLALAGDSSDNVPGVPGIGVKTAAQLLQTYGSLEALLARAGEIKQAKRRETLIDKADMARLSYDLVGLKDDVDLPVPLDAVARTAPDAEALRAYLAENGFRSLLNRIENVATPKAAGAKVETRYAAITNMGALDALIARAVAAGFVAIDTETSSLRVVEADLAGVSLSVEPGEGFYVPLNHVDEFGARVANQLERGPVLERLRPLLADPSVLKIGHNLKYDMGVLAHDGVEVAPIEDTLLLSYVLDGGLHGHGLDELVGIHLDHTTIPFEEVCGKGAKKITFPEAPLDKAIPYAAEDADVTLRLWRVLKARLVEERLTRVYETFERPLVPVIVRMEAAGIMVDRAVLDDLSATFGARMRTLEETMQKLAGRPFNPGSPKQLGELLFDEMGLSAGRKTKTGAHATGANVLEDLALQGHELPRVVLDWRQLQKLTRTYTEALAEDISPRTGRVHTSFSMAATATGRLSSNEPNLQNIPIRTEEGRKIRQAFVAEKGNLLISADYSQVELRILASVADIGALREAFANDIDIHAVTASQMFKVPLSETGGDMRRRAKTINYGIIYGIGAFGLAQRLGIDQGVARAYIDLYFEQYPGIRDYMERMKEEARAKGYVTTLDGRRCHIPEVNDKNFQRRAYAERAAINFPIQGTAADIMKRAMIGVDRTLKEEGFEARLLLQVHDELVLEAPEAEAGWLGVRLKEVMEAAATLAVPLVVEVGTGASWGTAH